MTEEATMEETVVPEEVFEEPKPKRKKKTRKAKPAAEFSFAIDTTPTLQDTVSAEDVLSAWLHMASSADVITPRGGATPYRTLRIPEAEYQAVAARFTT